MQPEKSVPVTTYCVVTAGDAIVLPEFGLLNVPVGAQLYCTPPLAIN
ncbi:MAG: hypothetical protein IPN56_06675 [Chitinophagaceae bacterium]|nr:hypothetical protein [Chitinophagaceae bacterium]